MDRETLTATQDGSPGAHQAAPEETERVQPPAPPEQVEAVSGGDGASANGSSRLGTAKASAQRLWVELRDGVSHPMTGAAATGAAVATAVGLFGLAEAAVAGFAGYMVYRLFRTARGEHRGAAPAA